MLSDVEDGHNLMLTRPQWQRWFHCNKRTAWWCDTHFRWRFFFSPVASYRLCSSQQRASHAFAP